MKGIIFDLDGVLIDSSNAWFVLFNMARVHFQETPISREEFETQIRGSNLTYDAERYFNVPVSHILAYFKKHQSILLTDCDFPDTKSTLATLKRKGYLLAIATNTPSVLAHEMIASVGIHSFFEVVVCLDDVPQGKPAPDMILKGLEELKLNKQEAVFVGDTQTDERAAQAAGVKYIGFGRNGDKRIDTLSELLDLL